MDSNVHFLDDPRCLEARQLQGFCEGWARPLSPEELLRVLQGSTHVVLAQDSASGRVVGFITAITDGAFAAYIPLLEVLRPFRGRGIGTRLVQLMLEKVQNYRTVDLVCDEDLVGFYRRLDLRPMRGMGLRR